jgi:hypothetical protein
VQILPGLNFFRMTVDTRKGKSDELMINNNNNNNNNLDYRNNQSYQYHADEKWEVQEVKIVVNIWEIDILL